MPQNQMNMVKSQNEILCEEEKQMEEGNKKRPKERHILDVLNMVKEWRRLYDGYYQENGNFFQVPLDTAAQIVGVSKKTLEDYLYQIKSANKYGFDFEKFKFHKIGILRSFVRREKEKEKRNANINNNNNNFNNNNKNNNANCQISSIFNFLYILNNINLKLKNFENLNC